MPLEEEKMDYFDINQILDNLDPLLDISDEPRIYATNIDFETVGIDTSAPEAQDGVWPNRSVRWIRPDLPVLRYVGEAISFREHKK